MTWIPFVPDVLRDAKARKIVRDCARALSEAGNGLPARNVVEVREQCVQRSRKLPDDVSLLTTLCCHVLSDLREQGWGMQVHGRQIGMMPPITENVSAHERKIQVRTAHLLERDAQLHQPPTRRFIREMEQRRLHRGSWCSIFSLMRDGRDLAEQLRRASDLPVGPARAKALRKCIDPYVQVAGPNDICQFTGLRLMDVWRYFRHTWTTSYLSTPGRKVWILVRDRAALNHPIIGIGALGSAVVQLAPRDRWIGWTLPSLLETLKAAPSARWARWLDRSLSQLIASVHVKDLLSERFITRAALYRPGTEDVARLRELAVVERRLHYLYPKRQMHKAAAAGGGKTNWEEEARSHLFRSKRAGMLADLLEARRCLQAAGFTRPRSTDLMRALSNRKSHHAIGTVLRYVKGAHVGVDMMDITICGAVAPYNVLLGGKLVSLLMTSPDVVRAYTRRYKSAVSVIASGMAGKAVRRRPSLVLLGTTSLYDVSPAQYNRLRMPARLAGGHEEEELAFLQLGRTVGFGSYHFSRATMATLELVLARRHGGRPVNSIFGEGVNPKLRKVRTGLDLLGMPSDALLQHRNPRVIYAVPLATNFKEVLLGLATRSKPIIPQRALTTRAIVVFWRDRWLSKRAERKETIDAVATNSLVYPIQHGARVTLPPVSGEQGPLFAITETSVNTNSAEFVDGARVGQVPALVASML